LLFFQSDLWKTPVNQQKRQVERGQDHLNQLVISQFTIDLV